MKARGIGTDDVIAAYRETGNNTKYTALKLGISPTTVRYHLQLVGIKRVHSRSRPSVDLLLKRLKEVRLEDLREKLREAYGKQGEK